MAKLILIENFLNKILRPFKVNFYTVNGHDPVPYYQEQFVYGDSKEDARQRFLEQFKHNGRIDFRGDI